MKRYFSLIACSTLIFSLSLTTQGQIRPKILSISEKLKKDDLVHFGYAVGVAAQRETGNKYYKLYRRLKAEATTEELVELTKGKSALMVVYAFDILQSRSFDGLKNIFFEHIGDTTWFWTAGGCTGVLDRVNWFMLRRLRPNENIASGHLTRSEFELYCDKFRKEDELFVCE